MGCDIHIAIEEKTEHGWMPVRFMNPIHQRPVKDRSTGYAAAQIAERNYPFFAALAGVRGIGPDAKGFPTDINQATKHWLEEHGGDHTPSWYPLAEFLSIYTQVEKDDTSEASEFARKYPASQFFYLDRGDEQPDRFRVIFNFDS